MIIDHNKYMFEIYFCINLVGKLETSSSVFIDTVMDVYNFLKKNQRRFKTMIGSRNGTF